MASYTKTNTHILLNALVRVAFATFFGGLFIVGIVLFILIVKDPLPNSSIRIPICDDHILDAFECLIVALIARRAFDELSGKR